MTKSDIIKFLENNKIKYELEEGTKNDIWSGSIYLPEYENIAGIHCHYWNCTIEVVGEDDFEMYDANGLTREYLNELNER